MSEATLPSGTSYYYYCRKPFCFSFSLVTWGITFIQCVAEVMVWYRTTPKLASYHDYGTVAHLCLCCHNIWLVVGPRSECMISRFAQIFPDIQPSEVISKATHPNYRKIPSTRIELWADRGPSYPPRERKFNCAFLDSRSQMTVAYHWGSKWRMSQKLRQLPHSLWRPIFSVLRTSFINHSLIISQWSPSPFTVPFPPDCTSKTQLFRSDTSSFSFKSWSKN